MADSVLRWGNPPAGVQNAPVYLGLSTGELGGPDIVVEASDNASGAEHTQALLDGAFDIGHLGAAPLMAALARTKEYAIVGTGLLRHPAQSLVVAPGVRGLRELRGKTVAINKRGTCAHSMLLTLMMREKMGEEELGLTTLGDAPAIVEGIRRGEVTAAVLWEPYTSMVLRETGWKVLTEGRRIWTPSRYCMMIYARRTLAVEAPVHIAGVLGAYGTCVRSAQGNTRAVADALIERMPHVPAEDVRSAVIREAPFWSADTTLDRGLLDRVIGELEVQAVLMAGFTLDDVIIAS